MQAHRAQRACSRLLIAGGLAVIAGVALGCGGDDATRPSVPMGAPVEAAPLDRPQLVIWSQYRLLLAGPDGGRAQVLVGARRLRAALFERPAWSPDGKRLAFTAQVGSQFASNTDIYLVRADGSGRRRRTSGGRSLHPVWSPDARWIYFAREGLAEEIDDSGRRRRPTSIWRMHPDGTNQRAVTAPIEGRYEIPGSFSPDGETLAFTRGTYVETDAEGREENTREIWVMRADGSDARRLAERSRDPAFSPDGRRIAFASDRDENGELDYGDRIFFANELYVMDADGSRPRRLTRTRALNELQPAWIPSGTRIAYQRGKDFQNAEATTVIQANADGSCTRPVFADPGPDAFPWYAAPAWRPGDARKGDEPLRC